MTFRYVAPIIAAIGLMASPAMAQQPQAQISRDAAPVEASNELLGQNSLLFYVGIAAIVAAILLLSVDEDDEAVSA